MLIGDRDGFVPCTPAGVQEMLARSGTDTKGKECVIVGRSNIVGKPMMALMVQNGPSANATVTVCHSATRDLKEHTLRAEILIVAAGRPKMVTGDMVKEGAVVIDVGINRIADASTKSGYRLVGDVDFEGARERASKITPVPGGVGPDDDRDAAQEHGPRGARRARRDEARDAAAGADGGARSSCSCSRWPSRRARTDRASSRSPLSGAMLIPGASPASAISVETLTQQAKDVIEGAFPRLWIRGEISDFKAYRSGHWYFCLRGRAARSSSA